LKSRSLDNKPKKKHFIGYTNGYETACSFLGLPIDIDYATFDKLIKATGLDLHYVDKGQYILGLQIYTGDLYDSFFTVDESIVQIIEKKKKLGELIAKAGIDLSDFMLQPIGNDPIRRVFHPQPYLIGC
jgi:hypothetical protein